MKSLPRKILYLGSDSSASSSRQRADALRRLGCRVTIVDPWALIRVRYRWRSFLDYRTGYRLIQKDLLQAVKNTFANNSLSFDVIWIDSGEFFGARILRWLSKRFACPIILYNLDDPTGLRDGARFGALIDAIPSYDLCIFVRQETGIEALALGAKRLLVVTRSYDERVHVSSRHNLIGAPSSVISFIGTFMPREFRDEFLDALKRSGLPLSLMGGGWQRSSLWPSLRSIYRGGACYGSAYSRALGESSINLGLLSHGNRDLVTQRSFETTACGSLLCAERTSEHQLLYENGWEAVFWDSVEECIMQCHKILGDSKLRHKISINGAHRVREMGIGNEDICRQVLASV
jgi:hypothetical protein